MHGAEGGMQRRTDERPSVTLDVIGQMDAMGLRHRNLLRRHAEILSAEGRRQRRAHRAPSTCRWAWM